LARRFPSCPAKIKAALGALWDYKPWHRRDKMRLGADFFFGRGVLALKNRAHQIMGAAVFI
jgi:hypothetical protein